MSIHGYLLLSILLATGPPVTLSSSPQTGQRGSLRGFVTDSTSGEVLVYATVAIHALATGTSTDTRGYYFLPSLPTGSHLVTVSMVGYRQKRFTVTIAEAEIREAHVTLARSEIELDEFIVVQERSILETDLGMRPITPEEISVVPPAIQPDIFRALQIDPGVSTTSDITARYYVRGGGSDQNAILLNGAVIYNPFHALGAFSVVDPEVVSVMEFYKGGFTPEYGGRLSSFLNVSTRDGNKNDYHLTAEASLLSAKVAVEGPIPNGSFLVTGRKSYNSKALTPYLGYQYPFDFYDVSFKVNYANPKVDENGKFVAYGFLSGDEVVNDDPLQEDYFLTNNIVGMTWYKVWSSPLQSRVSLSYSGFNAEVRPNFSSAKPRANDVHDITANLDFTYMYDSRDELRFGLHNTFLSTDLALETLFGNRHTYQKTGWDLNAYADYTLKRWETLGLHIGLRAKFLALSEIRPLLFEPRVSAIFRATPTTSIKAAIGWYSQEVTTLGDETEVVSIFEPWIIVPDYLASAEAMHAILGLATYLTENVSLEIEAYYKYMLDLIDINTRKFTSTNPDFVNVDGESYGLEAILSIHFRRIFLQTSYALAWAYRYREEHPYIPRYDSRHAVNVLLGCEFGSGWEASLAWWLKSGYPFTTIAGFYDRLVFDPMQPDPPRDYEPVVYWGDRHSSRLPVYHRLDVSASKRFRVDPVTVTLGLSFLNVYDRKNILYFDRDTGTVHNMVRFAPSFLVRIEL
jgi:hypothetical protein